MKKEARKILKYKDLKIEILCIWNVKPQTHHEAHAHSELNHFQITFKLQMYQVL